MGPRLTTAANIEEYVIFLEVEPLDDLRRQFGYEGGSVLVGLYVCKSGTLPLEWGKDLHQSTTYLVFQT